MGNERQRRDLRAGLLLAALAFASAGAGAPPQPSDATPPDAKALTEETFGVARQLLKDFPRLPDPLALMGTVYNQYRNTAEAERCWRQCLEQNPLRTDAYQGLAMIAAEKGEREKALELWRKAIQMDPKLAGAHCRCGMVLLEMGRTEEAIAELNQQIALAPDSSESYYQLGSAHHQRNEFDKAIAAFAKARELRPDDSRPCFGLAMAYARSGQDEEARKAREEFAALRAIENRTIQSRRAKANDREWAARVLAATLADAALVYGRAGHLRTAERQLQRGASLDPASTRCRERLVDLYLRMRRLEDAAAVCRELPRLDPRNPTYRLNLGVILARLGQLDAAEEALRKSLELAPERPPTLRSLVRLLLLRKHKLPEAKALAQKLIGLEKTAEDYAVLAEACYWDGDLSGARAAIARAGEINPRDREYTRVFRLIEKR